MTTTITTTVPFECLAGVEPVTDSTAYATEHYTASSNIRFVGGKPEKIGGWKEQSFDNGTITGVVRSIYSTTFGTRVQTAIGTNQKVYSVSGSILTNVTPLSTTPVAAPNSLSTLYGTLANNPITTVNGSNMITVADTSASRFKVGDAVSLSGATAVGGISAPNINGIRLIRSIGVNNYMVTAGASATSNATGGGASVVRSSGIVNVNSTAHGNIDGDRIAIANVSLQTASSATVANAGDGYAINTTLTLVGGTGTAATFTVASAKVATNSIVSSGTTGYVPGGTLTAVGGTFSTAATWTVNTTKVVSVSIVSAGASGTNGTQTLTGTTGSGTQFQISVTVSGGVVTSVNSILVAGSYTVNPTNVANEPTTGGGFGGTPPRFSLGMAVNTYTLGNAGDYTVLPSNPIATSGAGTGATFTATWGVLTVSLASPGNYSVSPTNPVTTTSSAGGTGATLNVTYSGAGTLGGITQAQINREFIVRNAVANSFDVMTDGFSTSSTTANGGASVVYYEEIPDGEVNEVAGQGYGMGMYGDGLYGTALLSQTGRVYPRIWFFDRYSETIIMNAGDNTPVYQWDGSAAIGPAPVLNAPDDVNYAFISDNILVTFGAGLVPNKIFSSDQGNITNWTASSTNFVYEKNIDSAGRLLSHANANGTNIIWSEQRSYTMRFIGLPNVWSIKPLETIGIIAPMARVVVSGIVYWMGLDNFYMWRGGSVEIIPSNSGKQSTLLRYVFDNLNTSQKSKCFAWYNKKFGEVWFHYPDEDSMEPNRVAVVSVKDGTWFPLEMGRTAAEYPEINLSVPRLATPDSRILRHETGYDDLDVPLPFSVTTNKKKRDKKVTMITAIIPDSIQNGNITLGSLSWDYPQSSIANYSNSYTVQNTTPSVQTRISGKIHQHTVSGAVLGQFWRMGEWEIETQPNGDN